MFSIEHVSYFIPGKRIKVEDNLERFRITRPQAKVFSKIYGLENIPFADGMDMKGVVRKSVDSLIAESGVKKEQIKVFIHTHTAKMIVPFGRSVVRELKNEIGLDNALAFGMSLNNCASTFNALETSAMLLKNYDDDARAIIVVGEMAFTPVVQVIPSASITGDASAAILIRLKNKDNKLIGMTMKTIGKYSKGIWLSPEESQSFEIEYVSLLVETIMSTIEKAKINLSDIKLILPHNVNLISWTNVIRKLNIDPNIVYLDNVRKTAHCFGADIFINYVCAMREKKIKKGDYYMMATVGLGATFAAAIFQY
jgi:3-oxoacyl-[acyl-carrier-protein] synthase III